MKRRRPTKPIANDENARRVLRLMKFGPLERRPGGWCFGARRIADHLVDRLVERGSITRNETRAWLTERPSP